MDFIRPNWDLLWVRLAQHVTSTNTGRQGPASVNLFNGLTVKSCPGHSGHIELPVCVYHPTFMDQLLRLLRAQCQYCHGLNMSKVVTNLYSCKLRLIHHGLLKEAAEIDSLEVPKVKGSNEEGDDVDSEDESENIVQKREAYVKRVLKAAGIHKKAGKPEKRTEAIAEERRFIIKV